MRNFIPVSTGGVVISRLLLWETMSYTFVSFIMQKYGGWSLDVGAAVAVAVSVDIVIT